MSRSAGLTTPEHQKNLRAGLLDHVHGEELPRWSGAGRVPEAVALTRPQVLEFSPEEWSRFARSAAGAGPDAAPVVATPGAQPARSLEAIPASDLCAVYQPLAELIRSRASRLSARDARPYLVGVAGGVAVGKSTISRALRVLIAGRSAGWRVDVATTDGFLYPNQELGARGLASRKGCPQSYDVARLVRFLEEIRSGRCEVGAPVYSHETYDVVPGRLERFHRPDVLILEGVNVLDATCGGPPFVPDLLDFRIYLDADERDMQEWYVERFVLLCRAGRDDPGAFYHRFAAMSQADITDLARQVWQAVNGPNLRQWVAPSREVADLVLEKGPDHAVRRIRLRTR